MTTIPFADRRQATAFARGLARALAHDHGIRLGHARSLDLVAHALGLAGGNVLMGSLANRNEPVSSPAPHASSPAPDPDSTPATPPAKAARTQLSPLDEGVREAVPARDETLEVDTDASISWGDDPGAYVQAWTWVAWTTDSASTILRRCRAASDRLSPEDWARIVDIVDSVLEDELQDLFDELVHDCADADAAKINNRGVDAQGRFVIEQPGENVVPEELRHDDPEGTLDELVHDCAAQCAADVNNGGLHTQCEFLIEQLGADALLDALLEAIRSH